jgi:hypothetical protein
LIWIGTADLSALFVERLGDKIRNKENEIFNPVFDLFVFLCHDSLAAGSLEVTCTRRGSASDPQRLQMSSSPGAHEQ